MPKNSPMNLIRDALIDVLEQHDAQNHPREQCVQSRVDALAFLAHSIGVQPTDLKLLAQYLEEYNRYCPYRQSQVRLQELRDASHKPVHQGPTTKPVLEGDVGPMQLASGVAVGVCGDAKPGAQLDSIFAQFMAPSGEWGQAYALSPATAENLRLLLAQSIVELELRTR